MFVVRVLVSPTVQLMFLLYDLRVNTYIFIVSLHVALIIHEYIISPLTQESLLQQFSIT
jgi:hypothetical protein